MLLNIQFPLDLQHPEAIVGRIVSRNAELTQPIHVIGMIGEKKVVWKQTITERFLVRENMRIAALRLFERFLIGIVCLGLLGISYELLLGRDKSIAIERALLDMHAPSLLIFWIGAMAFLTFLSSRIRRAHLPSLPSLPSQSNIPDLLIEEALTENEKKEVNVDHSLSAESMLLLHQTFCLVREQHHGILTPLHIVRAAEQREDFSLFCTRLGIGKEILIQRIDTLLSSLPQSSHSTPTINGHLYATLLAAAIESMRVHEEHISVITLIAACFLCENRLQELLIELERDPSDVRHIAEWFPLHREHQARARRIRNVASTKPKHFADRALTARPTPLLDSISTDFTYLAQSGRFPHLIGRDHELTEVFRTLLSKLGNVLIAGEPGTGKSEMLKGIANLMAAEHVPPHIRDKRFVVLDPGGLIGAAAGVGGIENVWRNVLREIENAGNILLGIEDIHHLLGASSTRSSEDAGHMLMNALSEGRIRVIATTTADEYSTHIHPVKTFLRRFQIVKLSEMGFHDCLKLMEAKASTMEKKYKVSFSLPALKHCYELTDQFLPDRHFPDKALQIMEESAALAKQKNGKGTVVGADDVAEIMSRKTNIAVGRVGVSEAAQLLHLEEVMHERIVGQEEAVHAIAAALRRSRTGLKPTHRPIATFIFLGPTGVGKTETAKTLAEVHFGDEKNMTRLDMSEYRTPESAERLLGSVGKSSTFLQEVQRNPHRLVLLDEFEKAHPDICNLFLQTFDDGRLTDGAGRTVDFSHTLIIASSNAGSARIQQGILKGEKMEDLERALLMEELPKFFPPELVNRFDRIVIFTPLTEEHTIQIARRMTSELEEALKRKGITFEITEEALRHLSARGFDRRFGARPLRRTIQDTLEDPISKILLQNGVARRDTICVGGEGRISVRKAKTI